MIEKYRPVALFVHDTQDSKRLVPTVNELVRNGRSDMNCVVGLDVVPLVMKANAAGTAQNDHAVLVLVRFETCIAFRCNLEISNLKLRLILRKKRAPRNRDPRPRLVLIVLALHLRPLERAPLLNQLKTTIGLRIVPAFIAAYASGSSAISMK